MTTHFDGNIDDYKRLEAYMDAVEGNGPQTTLFALLQEAGIEMPAPDALSDSDLTALLWKIIEGLADIGVYLTSTDHLSDRELYTVLWQDTLIQEHPIVPDEFQMMTHIDLLGGWSNEDMRTYLKYYADTRSARGSLQKPTLPFRSTKIRCFDGTICFPAPN